MLVWELTGAVIGAGMASGREIAAFFACYGRWGIVGIILSISMMFFLADTNLPCTWKHTWLERVWRLVQSMLLVCTGGAMLSGAGEVSALILTVPHAYLIGLICTMIFGWLLARHTVKGLATLSKVLLIVYIMILIAGMHLPPVKAINVTASNPLKAIISGITYGGFNAALQMPIMSATKQITSGEKKRAAGLSGALIGSVILLGYAVMMRHSDLMHEPLPFVALQKPIGKTGYLLASICLYLAILSTLTACLRGLNTSRIALAVILLVSSLGLSGVIENVYPVLGSLCFLFLLAAKLTNCLIPPFHSRENMI